LVRYRLRGWGRGPMMWRQGALKGDGGTRDNTKEAIITLFQNLVEADRRRICVFCVGGELPGALRITIGLLIDPFFVTDALRIIHSARKKIIEIKKTCRNHFTRLVLYCTLSKNARNDALLLVSDGVVT